MQYFSENKIDIFSQFYLALKVRILEKLHSLFDIIAFSSLILAITGGFGVYASCSIENIPWCPASAIIMTLVSFSVYNLNRKTDEQEDKINHLKRFSFTKKFEKPLLFGALFSYALALTISAFYGIDALIVACIPLISGILYSESILPPSWRFRRLKEIPVVKNVFVASAWALTLSLLPVCIVSSVPGQDVLISGIFFFTYVFMASVLPDIRDREGDSIVGVVTLPVLIGIPRTNIILIVITSILGGLIFLTRSPFASQDIIFIFGIFYIFFCILSMGRFVRTNFVCDYLADGGFILLGLLSLILDLPGLIN
ncbi:MAG TPA: UbiA family prenyltransferase [Methanoregulaceae archaeon]|nr:UbiA family prenyltransferase [Methanoregulaceae archaeon]